MHQLASRAARDLVEIASLAAFVVMIGLIAHAFGT